MLTLRIGGPRSNYADIGGAGEKMRFIDYEITTNIEALSDLLITNVVKILKFKIDNSRNILRFLYFNSCGSVECCRHSKIPI